MKKHFCIHIGGYMASREPAVIQTLLGSCVSCCLYDPVRRIGGMNHILLPGEADMRVFNEPARCGIHAMELLINEIMKLGGTRASLVGKVFGGAHMLPTISPENGMGRRNISFCFNFLKNEQIRVASYDVGGVNARKIFFHTDSGDVFLRRIPSSKATLVERERQSMENISEKAATPAKITFF